MDIRLLEWQGGDRIGWGVLRLPWTHCLGFTVKDGEQVLGEREVLSLEWQKLSEKFGKRRVHEMRRRFMSAAERD